MDFSGKRAIVTGSATGLGAAIARKLCAGGAKVVINYTKSEAEAKETAALCAKDGGETRLVRANVAEDADCHRLVEEAQKVWGGVDILVNNAGTTKFVAHEDLDGLSAEDFLHIYSVNVVGAYQMARAVAPLMKKAGDGRIVNIASIAGVTGVGSSIAYAASKGAMVTMTLSLARALAPSIRVNAVCPGFIGTRWFKDRFGDEVYDRLVAEQEKTMPLRRAGTPESVAESVLFFCGAGADHITGETLICDAGMHLGVAPRTAR